jgi:hypothetical protein
MKPIEKKKILKLPKGAIALDESDSEPSIDNYDLQDIVN